MKLRELTQAQKIDMINDIIIDLENSIHLDKMGFICNTTVERLKEIFDVIPVIEQGTNLAIKKTFPEMYKMILKVGQELIDKEYAEVGYYMSLPWSFDIDMPYEEKIEFKIQQLNKLLKEIS